jgi:hypothetical protein
VRSANFKAGMLVVLLECPGFVTLALIEVKFTLRYQLGRAPRHKMTAVKNHSMALKDGDTKI